MAQFPLLNSGAITQYPAAVTYGQAVQVVRFLDGSDQRYLSQGSVLRMWEIRVDLLTDAEIFAIEQFFEGQNGNSQFFSFPDPITNVLTPNCIFGSPEIAFAYTGVNTSSTSFWVLETKGAIPSSV
jgi:hypothetical protein